MITTADLIIAYSAETLKQWADDDRDGVADTAILTAFITRAESEVNAALYPAYSADMPFTSGNEPQVVKEIAITVAGYHLSGRRQQRPKVLKETYEAAKEQLDALTQKGVVLLLPDGTSITSQGTPGQNTSYAIYSSTEDTDRTFSDERMSDFVGDEP